MAKKKGFSVWEDIGSYDSVWEHIKWFFRGFKHMYQRARYGYSDRDTWNLRGWFLAIVPEMLQEYRDNGDPYIVHDSGLWQDLNDEDFYPTEEQEAEDRKKWQNMLDRLIYCLHGAGWKTPEAKNKYEEAFQKLEEEAAARYGADNAFEHLDWKDQEFEHLCTFHYKAETPEQREIREGYFREELRTDKYASDCKNEALDLFKEWFWCFQEMPPRERREIEKAIAKAQKHRTKNISFFLKTTTN